MIVVSSSCVVSASPGSLSRARVAGERRRQYVVALRQQIVMLRPAWKLEEAVQQEQRRPFAALVQLEVDAADRQAAHLSARGRGRAEAIASGPKRGAFDHH